MAITTIPAPARILRIAVTIAVTDIARASAFYQHAFGFEEVFRNGYPVGFVIMRRDAVEVHLTCDREHRSTTQNVAHLLVEDANNLFERLRGMGARIIKGIRDEEYGLRAFVVADPDGNRLDIGQKVQTPCSNPDAR